MCTGYVNEDIRSIKNVKMVLLAVECFFFCWYAKDLCILFVILKRGKGGRLEYNTSVTRPPWNTQRH